MEKGSDHKRVGPTNTDSQPCSDRKIPDASQMEFELEGDQCGLAKATWHMFAEQFYNERLIVDVLNMGASVGAKVYGVKQEERPVIEAGEIERVIAKLKEAEERRARELEEILERAVEEGGSFVGRYE